MIRHPFSIDGQLTVNRRLTGGKLVWVARGSLGWWVRGGVDDEGAEGEALSVAAGGAQGMLANCLIFVLFVQLDVELDTVEQQALD